MAIYTFGWFLATLASVTVPLLGFLPGLLRKEETGDWGLSEQPILECPWCGQPYVEVDVAAQTACSISCAEAWEQHHFA